MKNKKVFNSLKSLKIQNQDAQVKSGIKILKNLWLKQKECGVEEPCEELQLDVKRIIRGLAASSSTTRKGYFLTFVGLCELFSSSTLTVQMCFDAVEKELQVCSTQSETDDWYKGQLLVYGGLIHSGKILQASREEIKTFLQQLIIIRGKKSHLMLAADTFLIDYLNKVDENTFTESEWKIIHEEIVLKNKENKSLEWYYLLCVISKKFPQFVNKEFFNNLIGCSKIFHKNNVESIGKLILSVPYSSIHTAAPVYKYIIHNLVNNDKLFKMFWLMVDEQLSSVDSIMIDYVFKLFISCIEELSDKNSIITMFTPNFVKLLETKCEANSLEKVRLDVITKFYKIVSEKDIVNFETQKTLVHKLLLCPRSLNFLYGPGLVFFQNFVNNSDKATVKSVVKSCIDVLASNSEVEGNKLSILIKKRKIDWQKKTACSVVIKLLGHPTVVSSIKWKVEQMKTIINIAFFSKTPSELVQDARRCFYSALDFKFKNLTDMCSFLRRLVLYFNSKIHENNCAFEFSNEMKKAWKKMLKTVDTIADERSNTDKEQLTDVFRVLLMLFGLTIFTDSDVAIENIKELCVLYKQKCSELHSPKNVDDKIELRWTDVIVDLMLSLLSNSHHFLRNVVFKVFIFLCPHFSSENIHQLLHVLNPTENVLSAYVSKSDTSNEKNEDIKVGRSVDEEDNDSNYSGSSVESDLEEEIDDFTELDKKRALLREALGDAGAGSDTESINVDNLEEEEANRLDKSLSKVVKQMKASALKAKTAEHKQLSDFRIRVLTLLKIWLKTKPELNILFDVMVTALTLLETSLQNTKDLELQTKLKKFVKHMTSVKDFSTEDKVHVKQLAGLMKKLMNKENTASSIYVKMWPQIVDCCTFILKISLNDIKQKKKLRPLILEAYKNALDNLFNKKNSIVLVGLFKSAFALPWEGSLDLIQDVVNYSLKPGVRLINLTHGFALLLIFLRNKRLINPDNRDKYNDGICQIATKLADNIDVLKKQPKIHVQYNEVWQCIKNLNVASDIIDTIKIDPLKKGSKRKLKDESTSPKAKAKITKVADDVEDLDIEVTNKENESTGRSDSSRRKRKKKIEKHEKEIKKNRKIASFSEGLQNGVFKRHLHDNSPITNSEMQNNDDGIPDSDEDLAIKVANEENKSTGKTDFLRHKRKKNINKRKREIKKNRKIANFNKGAEGLQDGVFGRHLCDILMNGEMKNNDDNSEND